MNATKVVPALGVVAAPASQSVVQLPAKGDVKFPSVKVNIQLCSLVYVDCTLLTG
jgi:hypothetical protein